MKTLQELKEKYHSLLGLAQDQEISHEVTEYPLFTKFTSLEHPEGGTLLIDCYELAEAPGVFLSWVSWVKSGTRVTLDATFYVPKGGNYDLG